MMVPDEIRGYKYLDWPNIAADMAKRFKAVLETAKEEKPVQEFFEANPVALLVGVDRPHRGWVLPRQALPKPSGGSWIPDFWSAIGRRSGHYGLWLNLKARMLASSTQKDCLKSSIMHMDRLETTAII